MVCQPLISVIITAFNGAGTIECAVKSGTKQTFQDHEIIVADDASAIVPAMAAPCVLFDRIGAHLGEMVWGTVGGGGGERRGEDDLFSCFMFYKSKIDDRRFGVRVYFFGCFLHTMRLWRHDLFAMWHGKFGTRTNAQNLYSGKTINIER